MQYSFGYIRMHKRVQAQTFSVWSVKDSVHHIMTEVRNISQLSTDSIRFEEINTYRVQ